METKIYKSKVLTVGIILITIVFNTFAQQDPLNTQYIFNTQSINPAYAGTWETVGFTVLAGQQWNGFDEAPQSYIFSIQAPLSNKKTGLGLNIINDKIGFDKRFCVFGDYSYLIEVGRNSNLRLGVKGGFTNYSNHSNHNLLKSADVTSESNNTSEKTMLNAGAGIFLYNSNYYVGFSVPDVLNNRLINDLDNSNFSYENQPYYLMSGLVLNLGSNLIFKPSTMAFATFASNTSRKAEINLAANFLLKEKLWFGAMVGTYNGYGFMAQWIFKGNLRLGYAYDTIASNSNIQKNSSHKLMLSYELATLKNSLGTLRYF